MCVCVCVCVYVCVCVCSLSLHLLTNVQRLYYQVNEEVRKDVFKLIYPVI